MSKRICSLFLVGLLFVAGCSVLDNRVEPTIQARVEQTVTVFTEVPSATPYPTYTSYPSLTPDPTYTPLIVIVTTTATKTPRFTSTTTGTPTETMMPTATLDHTKEDKPPGFYLVGSEISPGIWRSLGSSDSCYWSITTKTGSIIKNHFGMSGGTMYITESAFQVQLDEDCGNWTYLGE